MTRSTLACETVVTQALLSGDDQPILARQPVFAAAERAMAACTSVWVPVYRGAGEALHSHITGPHIHVSSRHQHWHCKASIVKQTLLPRDDQPTPAVHLSIPPLHRHRQQLHCPAHKCTLGNGVFVGDWLFVLPLCGFSLSLFCNYPWECAALPLIVERLP